ncbi:MAG: multicopper oxidase domain-containing protein [Halioglobus sp.]|nr:multicopper oxidase domain-containing protein [Halioglobus sp.]
MAPNFSYKVWAFNGQVPGPLLHVKEGDEVEVVVQNNTTLNHTIHWHGTLPDRHLALRRRTGHYPGGHRAGESYTYRFAADKPGTLWYHCHVDVPEHVGIRGMWGPMIVEPKEPASAGEKVSKEAILMFSGWNPEVADTYGEGGHPNEPISYFSINGKSFPSDPSRCG